MCVYVIAYVVDMVMVYKRIAMVTLDYRGIAKVTEGTKELPWLHVREYRGHGYRELQRNCHGYTLHIFPFLPPSISPSHTHT